MQLFKSHKVQETPTKIHNSEYIRTMNNTSEEKPDGKPEAPTEPAKPESE